jgi:flagellar protein FliO/FliZ
MMRPSPSIAAFVLGISVTAAQAVAEGRFAAPTAAVREPVASGAGIVQVLLSLVVVVAAILLLGWAARRFRTLPLGRGGALRIVDELALGAKERAVILEVDGERLVLGVGEGRVALLHRSPAPPQVAAPAAEGPAGAVAPAPQRFAELLRQAVGR